MFTAAKPAAPHSIALCGGSGSGKTRTALHIARAIAKDAAIAGIDVGERQSLAGYSDIVPHDIVAVPYSSARGHYSFTLFHDALNAAIAAQYGCIVIDSLSEMWLSTLAYKEGLDRAGGNAFAHWGEAGRLWDDIIRAIQQSPVRVIATLRAEMEYVQETDERSGRKKVQSLGLQPVARTGKRGIEYEFDIWCQMSNQILSVVQPRHCLALDGLVLERPTVEDCIVFR